MFPLRGCLCILGEVATSFSFEKVVFVEALFGGPELILPWTPEPGTLWESLVCLGESAGSDMAAAAVCAGQGLLHWPPDCSLATKKKE